MLAAVRRVVPGLWAGMLCAVGYLAAPVLFAVLESRSTAGLLAGTMFTVATVCSLVLAGVLLAAWPRGTGARRHRILALLAAGLLAANEWGLRPVMEAARLADGTPGPGFGALHGVSAVMWLAATGLVLWLSALEPPAVSGRAG